MYPHAAQLVPAALGGNFLGLTSGLLSLDGGRFAAKFYLDVLFPVKGYKRCVEDTFGGWLDSRCGGMWGGVPGCILGLEFRARLLGGGTDVWSVIQ